MEQAECQGGRCYGWFDITRLPPENMAELLMAQIGDLGIAGYTRRRVTRLVRKNYSAKQKGVK